MEKAVFITDSVLHEIDGSWRTYPSLSRKAKIAVLPYFAGWVRPEDRDNQPSRLEIPAFA